MIILSECIVACIIFTIPLIILSRNPLAGIWIYIFNLDNCGLVRCLYN